MLKRSIATIALIALAGCGDEVTGPTAASLAGTWTLQSVNGLAVPATITGLGANRSDAVSGSVVLTAAATYTQTVSIVSYVSGQATPTNPSDAGSFTIIGSTIEFTSSVGGSSQTATVTGNTMSLTFQGLAVVFAKQ